MEARVQYDGKTLVSSSDGDSPAHEIPIEVQVHTKTFPDGDLTEQWVTITNRSQACVRIERLDSVQFTLPAGSYELMYFTGSWGLEFEPVRRALEQDVSLHNQSGRSSQGIHPWFTLFGDAGLVISGTVMWSGNWIWRFERQPDESWMVSGGLDDWEFYKDLMPGESMESPHVAVAKGAHGDLDETAILFARAGRTRWYPKNLLSETLPVEWNHWWSYEDTFINEETFKQNVDVAAELGFDVATLDAGWFGPSEAGTHWYDYRGDWDLVNTVRFPNGIRALSDYTHERGLKFGLWCEIEAVGESSTLAKTRSDLVAKRDGQSLGYVCFGNPDAEEWAYQTLHRIISEYDCDWIKLDFNLDPGAGCNRTDHGHGAGDGLYEHYLGYYKVLSRIRRDHRHVLLENCSSGGLRIDLGILSQTHTTFLSDPDWPEHNLQLFWGATTMLAPNVCLHWGYSDWLTEHRCQKFNPHDPALTEHQLDYYVRISMLGGIGFSQKLPQLPRWIHDRYLHHAAVYKRFVSKFVAHADLYRLTDQPKRFGAGARWAAFQYSMPDASEHLLFVFRLDGATSEERIRLKNLQADRQYQLAWLSDDRTEYFTGSELMQDGVLFRELREEESSLILLL